MSAATAPVSDGHRYLPPPPERVLAAIAAAREALACAYAEDISRVSSLCMHFGWAAVMGGVLAGRRIYLQAGSACWRIKPDAAPDDDDTFLAYDWNPQSPRSMEQIAQDKLPEVHVWAVDMTPDGPPVLLDLCIPRLPWAARDVGVVWSTPRPAPDDVAVEQPVTHRLFPALGWAYIANEEATIYAIKRAQRIALRPEWRARMIAAKRVA